VTTYYCTDCGNPKQDVQLQPSTDAKDRWRLGKCCLTGLSVFALTYDPPPKRARAPAKPKPL